MGYSARIGDLSLEADDLLALRKDDGFLLPHRLVLPPQLRPCQSFHPPPELGLFPLLLDDTFNLTPLRGQLLEQLLAFRPRPVQLPQQLRIPGAHPVRDHASVAKRREDERDLARGRRKGDKGARGRHSVMFTSARLGSLRLVRMVCH